MSKQTPKDGRIVLEELEARENLLKGAKATYEAVATTFGPKGRNVLVEKPFGRPVLTRDGVTVAREVYFSDRSKNMGSQLLLEASETTNRFAGDGTSASVVLGYNLFANGVQAIAAGIHPMGIKQIYLEDSYKVLDKLNEIAKPVADGQLKQVASVSAGDEALGEMIAEAIEKVGPEGGVLAEKAPIETVECEFVEGYFLQTGFQALERGKKQINQPLVVVSQRRFSSAADANELLTKTLQARGVTPQSMQEGNLPKLLLIGNIEEAAYLFIVNLINQGAIDAVILKTPPQFGDMGKQLLEDIAIYAGCQVITDSVNLKEFTSQYVGTVDKVVASKGESTLFVKGETEEINVRVQEIKEQIAAETVEAILEKLKERVAKLQGKIALFKVGAATDTGREELEFRVDDAIKATRAAALHGVIPGGGSTLLDLSKLDISTYYRDALQSTFKRLLTNANLKAEVKLEEALGSKSGMGYNLRKNEELVDMVEAGILDPKLVLEQVIKNATETAGNILTIGTALISEEQAS